MDKCYLYILQSQKSGIYYIGFTKDIDRRVHEHNSQQVTATTNKGPWDLRFKQEYSSAKEARQIEIKLKKLKRRDIIARIIQDQQIKLKI